MIYIWIDILIDRIYNNVKIKYGLTRETDKKTV